MEACPGEMEPRRFGSTRRGNREGEDASFDAPRMEMDGGVALRRVAS